MKILRILGVLAWLLLSPCLWAQDTAVQPPASKPDSLSMGPVTAAQGQPDMLPPPPPGAVIQRRVIGSGNGNVTYMTTGGPGLGDSLGAWWKNSEIVGKLQLSPQQVTKISQTFLDHKLKLIDLQADLDKQELRLQPLLDVDHPEEAKVGAQIDMITAARGRLEKENAMMMLAIRSQLSVEQWKKLKLLEATEEGKQKVFFWRSGPGINAEGFPLPPGEPPVVRVPVPPR